MSNGYCKGLPKAISGLKSIILATPTWLLFVDYFNRVSEHYHMPAGPILLGTVSVQSYQISTKKKISLKYRED